MSFSTTGCRPLTLQRRPRRECLQTDQDSRSGRLRFDQRKRPQGRTETTVRVRARTTPALAQAAGSGSQKVSLGDATSKAGKRSSMSFAGGYCRWASQAALSAYCS